MAFTAYKDQKGQFQVRISKFPNKNEDIGVLKCVANVEYLNNGLQDHVLCILRRFRSFQRGTFGLFKSLQVKLSTLNCQIFDILWGTGSLDAV